VDRSRVTVVLPTYNRAESLARCLRALLGGDVGEREVVVRVVDDGSTDGTGETVRALAGECRGAVSLEYHRQANAGCCAARNRGIEAAETDLLLFLDDDCVPERGWLRGLVEAPWEEGLGAVGGTIVSPPSDSVVSRYCRWIGYDEYPPRRGRGAVDRVDTANCAFLRRALLQAGGFEPGLANGGPDIDMSHRVARAGYRLHHAPEAVVVHHHRETARALARAYRKRGDRHLLRRVMWGYEPFPTWAGLAREAGRFAWGNGRLLLLPLAARRLRKRGVAPRDALAFAYLEWLRQTSDSLGRMAMMSRLLRGLETTERRYPLPPPPSGESGQG